jgi:anti-anti-sigma regulatory factor
MPVQFSRVGEIGILRVVGRLDTQGTAELERAVFDAITSTPALVLDVGEATDVSPAALRVIVMLDTVMSHRGQVLCICPSDSLMRRGLDVANLALRAWHAPALAVAEKLLSGRTAQHLTDKQA